MGLLVTGRQSMRGSIVASCLVVALVAASVFGQAPAGAPGGAGKVSDTALLIIDIQAFYFEGGTMPLVKPVEASLQARKLLERFRALHLPVVHVQHLPKGVEKPDPTGVEPQYRIHPNVLPAAGETVIGKHKPNSFVGTDLLERLRALKVAKLVIVGMQTHMCVEAATRAAADLGFEVTLVDDACTTRDLAFRGRTVPAAHVHAAVLAAMSGSYARIATSDELLSELR
jgi:nicotinamidase-related amidase